MENNTPKRRPTGVTVIAMLNFVGAGFIVLYILYLAITKAPLTNLPPELADSPLPPELFRAIFTGALLFAAALNLVLGIGLLKLHNWARIVVLVFAGIGLFFNVIGVLVAAGRADDSTLFSGLLTIAYNGWIFWYLLQGHVNLAFAKVVPLPPAPPASTPPEPPPPPLGPGNEP